ncbi:MAG TPA: 4-hydroxy-3-methylbut-2-enyl diphosphate reductase, partial [Flavisolibacter sp.]|nr:4-hydroxy-3-methylbut-2-enyl diphosphate reductase [Flavisolibacter sp.]
IPFEELTAQDVVLIPAFGTTLDIEKRLRSIGIAIENYNTTCPFVEKVWNRSEAIAKNGYTVIVHGKPSHEETRATFSHASFAAPTVVVKDMEQAKRLAAYIAKEKPEADFYKEFEHQFSEGFNPSVDLKRIGVVNQTTMLASDTQAISDYLKEVVASYYRLDETTIKEHFADTRDTLCYATNDNQSAVYGMLKMKADLAIVVGGYNSSNTSHLVELCEEKLPTYYISDSEKILSQSALLHYDFHHKNEVLTEPFLPTANPATILITSGASCPDAIVENVIKKLAEYYPASRSIESITEEFTGSF